MSLATFCIIVGIYEVMIGLPMVVRPAVTSRWFEGALKEDTLLRLVCYFFLVIAVLVLSEGAAISASNEGIVRFLAWATAGKCIVICWWPQWVIAMKGWYWGKPKVIRVFGVAATALGVWLLNVSCSISG